MKRSIKVLVLGLMIASLVAGAASAVTFVNIATGSTGGSYYPLGGGMAKIWNDNITGIKASAQSTGGTVNNIQLMESKEADAAFMDGLYYYAYLGKDKFEGNAQDHIRALVPLYPEPIQLMIAKNSGIKTLQDFKGKRVSIGAVASGTEVTARQLLKAAGIDPDKDITAENLGVGDTASAFSDNRIDAAVMVGSLGMAGVIEATTLGVVEFIDVPDDIRDKVIQETPYWVPFNIPADFYSNQPNEVRTYASWNIVAVHQDLDADLVYQMTKALFEHKEDLLAVRATMQTMAPENAKYILIPLHDGAKKYYDEVSK